MDNLHLKHKKYLMNKSEHDFYQLLILILGNRYYIFPQIHIGSIAKPRAGKNKDGSWRWWRYVRWKSDQYSVDFVICDKKRIMPKLVIELDDPSHETRKRATRDKTIERWLNETELDLLRVTTSDSVEKELVRNLLANHLSF